MHTSKIDLLTNICMKKTPDEAWFGHKPSVSHFRVFGSKAWARIPPEKRKALKPQIKQSIMVGYVEYAKRVVEVLDLVHSYLIGPIPTPSYGDQGMY